MADTRILLNGLEAYHQALERHHSMLRLEYDYLDNTWRRLDEIYQGDAADEFRSHWMRTAGRFNEYVHQTGLIAGLLREGIEHLRQANRAEGGLLG